jgi:phage shock protein E
MDIIRQNKLLIIGVIIGAIGGFAYYHFAGCSGSCPISSKLLNSTLYGAVVGALLFSSFKKDNSVKN